MAQTQKMYLGDTPIGITRFGEHGNTINGAFPIPIITQDLEHKYDASNPGASPSSTWDDLVGSKNGSYAAATGVTYVATAPSYFNFAGTSDNKIDFALPLPTFMSGTGTKSFTLQFWVNMRNITTQQTILHIGDTSTAGAALEVLIRSTGDLRFQFGSTGARNTTFNPTINTWHQITVTKDGSTVGDYDMYLDNTNIGTLPILTQSTNLPTNDTHAFGTAESGRASMYIGEYLIYDRVLSSAEVTNNYNALKDRFGVSVSGLGGSSEAESSSSSWDDSGTWDDSGSWSE